MSKLKDTYNRLLRDLRVSVTDRCNFRCPYCMPIEIYGDRYQFLDRTEILSFEEIIRLVQLFVSLGVSKVRLTGGEPLVRQGIEHLIAMLSENPDIKDLSLTTNGYLLGAKAQKLKDSGLSRITVSLDSLDDQTFKRMSGSSYNIDKVLAGIEKADEVGFRPIKINAVVQKGVNEHTIVQLAHHFKGTGHILRFIEYMDVGTLNGWKLDQVLTGTQIARLIDNELPLERMEPNYTGEVARRYRYVDGTGEIGIITSVSEPFCYSCTRARLSTDGKVYTCLFAGSGHDLRKLMRDGASDEDLKDRITGIWEQRKDRYSEKRASMTGPSPKKIEMYQIGG